MSDINDDIRTANGWKKLKDIIDGDIVFGIDGKPCNVLKAHEIQEKEAYKLVFDTGEEIICDENHLWYTINKLEDKRIRRGKAKHGSVKTTKEIAETIKYKNRETNHRIPICQPLEFNEKNLPINPYALGLWLGDGSSAGAEITIYESEIIEHLENDGYILKKYKQNKEKTPRYGISTGKEKSFHTILKELNLYKNKHIPFLYKNSSIKQRTELLKGLMDSDGFCGKKLGHCEFCSIKENLANDVFELISSLGIKTRIEKGLAKLNGKIISEKFKIRFKTDYPVFKLKRKLNNQLSATKNQMSRHKNRFIVKAEKIKNAKMRCLTVDSDDHLFLITKSFIATHNTRTGCEAIKYLVNSGKAKRIGIIAPTASDARDVLIEGESGILNIYPKGKRPTYEPSKRKVTFPNGAIAHTFSADEPERLRGPQFDLLYMDENAAWKYPETYDMAMFGLRLGDDPKCIITTTPKPVPLIKKLIKMKNVYITKGTTYENKNNLAEAYLEQVITEYEGTRLGRQELRGEILEDTEGALWNRELIESSRIKKEELPNLTRIVVAVDPSMTFNKSSNETGIVVAGINEDGEGFIIDDLTFKATPNAWAERAINAYYSYDADLIIGEANNGGDLVQNTVKTIDENVNFKKVYASRGKYTRAEPVAALYEQHKIYHAGSFPKLEDQMTNWIPGTKSPDALDAMVWSITELMLKRKKNRMPNFRNTGGLEGSSRWNT